MAGKPTHEELERRVKKLEKEAVERDLAEKALKESEKEWRAVVENAPGFISIADRDGTIRYVNRTVPGITIDEVIGRNIKDFEKPEYRPISRQAIEQVFRFGKSGSYQAMGLGPDASNSWYEIHYGPIKRDGQVVGVTFITTDITERKKAEDALRSERDFNKTLIEASPAFFVAIDPDGKTLMMNEAMLQALGYTLDEVRGTHFPSTFVPEHDREILSELFKTLSKQRAPTLHENRIVTKNDRELLVEWHGRPAINAQGEFEFLFAVGIDITERRQAEEELRESEEKYRLLIDNYGDPINVYDRDGISLVMNTASAARFGGKPEDFIGKSVYDHFPDNADAIMKRNQQVIESGKGANFEDIFEFPTGKRWFWSNLQPVKDVNGNTYAVQIISYDITERKRAEKELQKAHDELEQRVGKRTAELVKANKELQHQMGERKRLEKVLMQREKLNTLGAIAAEVAHEIRNPLVSIGGFAQRLKQKFPDLPECDIILSESERLERILSRIRSYLEPVEIHPIGCSVNTVITDCLNLLSPETEARHVKCVLDLSAKLPSAYVDPEILAQIFINLIRNAAEAMKKGGALFIKSFETDQDVHIEFKNQAPGLKIGHADALFMPFAEGGQSLGLPLCYRLLRDMGGILSFVQENDYMIFTVSLPTTVQPEPEKKEFGIE